MTQLQQPVKWEMHAHTSPVSRCGHLSAQEVVEGVAAHGYRGLVITDHYDPERFWGADRGAAFRKEVKELYSGYRDAVEAGARAGVIVLPSAELRIEYGSEDYLLYGLTEELALEAGCLTGLRLGQVRARLHPLGVLIVQAHPFRRGQFPADPKLLDGVEVYNGNPRHDSGNDRSLKLAREHGLLMTRGSDIHQSSDFASAHMMLPEVRDAAALVEALKQYAHE